ncbi:protein of unknown function [Nitrospira japonica]|uniref:Uncharacterized protein n=1 Tax=Nitrospira japonica TaxID=1325564 RepID=A0A1W1I8I5_9BACT|nr:protein of unknown function [Nitrospira japonica]
MRLRALKTSDARGRAASVQADRAITRHADEEEPDQRGRLTSFGDICYKAVTLIPPRRSPPLSSRRLSCRTRTGSGRAEPC